MDPTEAGIHRTLSALQSDFFSALQSADSKALPSFEAAWTAFIAEIESSVDKLHEETKSSIYSFATVINIVTAKLLEVDDASLNISQQFREDMIKILPTEFSKLTIHDTEPTSS